MKHTSNRSRALSQRALGVGLTLGMCMSLALPGAADARLIFTTEGDGVNADTYSLDNDDSSVDMVNLSFGSAASTEDAFLRYDKILDKFIFSQDLDMSGKQILNFLVENHADGTTLSETATGLLGATSITLDGTGHGLSVGDFITLPGGPAHELEMYQIKAIDGTGLIIEIDQALEVPLSGAAVIVDGAPPCNADSLGRMYYNTTNGNLLFCTDSADSPGTYQWVTNQDNSVTGVMLDPAVAGEGLVQDANGNLDVNVDGTSLTIAGDEVQIAEGGVGAYELADNSITQDDLQTRLETAVLTPEYPNFTLYGDGSNNIGTLEADHDPTSGRNFYQWSTMKGRGSETAQDYTIVVQWPIPDGFQGFCQPTSGVGDLACTSEMTVDYATESTDGNLSRIDLLVEDTAGTTVDMVGSTEDVMVSTVGGDWEDDYALEFATEDDGDWTTGEFLTIKLNLTSKSDWSGNIHDNQNPVKVGEIKFNYLTK